MAEQIELNPVDFLTVGTVGPKGRRIFHLQGAKENQLITVTLEKFQTSALSDAINELLEELDQNHPLAPDQRTLPPQNMDLREPIEPAFRVSQMGLGYEEDTDMIVLVAQELVATDEDALEIGMEAEPEPNIVRFWASRARMRALSSRATAVVEQGRPDPQSNGRLLYYWT